MSRNEQYSDEFFVSQDRQDHDIKLSLIRYVLRIFDKNRRKKVFCGFESSRIMCK